MQCDHTKTDIIHCCSNCGADLNLRQQEITSRDRLFTIFNELLKKQHPDMDTFDRTFFDDFVSKNGAFIALSIAKMFAGDDNKQPEKEDLKERISKLEKELEEIKKLV